MDAVLRLAIAILALALALGATASATATLQEAERLFRSLTPSATAQERSAVVEAYTKVLSRLDLSTVERAKALAYRGTLYEKLGQIDSARKDFDAAVVLLPNDWLVWQRRGEIAMVQRDGETAISDFSKAIELSTPESKDQFVMRGDAYFLHGQYEQAITDYVHAVKLSKRNAAQIMGPDYASRTRTFDLAPIYQKLAAAYSALAAKSQEIR